MIVFLVFGDENDFSHDFEITANELCVRVCSWLDARVVENKLNCM